jgi:hypothetical protein
VLITDLNYQTVPLVQMDSSMTEFMSIAKIAVINILTVLLVMLIPVILVKEEEKLHSVPVQLEPPNLTESVLIVHTDVPPVPEVTQTIVSLVLEKETLQTLVHVHTDSLMTVSKMLNVHLVLTNVPDVNTMLKTVPSVKLTEPQFQPVTVNTV